LQSKANSSEERLVESQNLPLISGPLPGPKAHRIIERDGRALSPSYTRGYPLVADRGEGAIVIDVDGNRFLDFNSGIAVVATGHCHPNVVKAIQDQAARLIHMSGTDFYYENMVTLAEKLAAIAPVESSAVFTSATRDRSHRGRAQSSLDIGPAASASSPSPALSMVGPSALFR
jgi:4-aminobutyrate aminotransferase-like enzyme